MYSTKTLVFSTLLYDGPTAPPQDWWYYAFDTGQHVSFYTRNTMQELAAKLQLYFYSQRGLHILTDRQLDWGSLRSRLRQIAFRVLEPALRMPVSKTLSDHARLLGKT